MLRGLLNSSMIRFTVDNKNLLKSFGIVNPNIVRNLSVPEYYECGLNVTPSDTEVKVSEISNTGAFVAYSGAKTGRSPSAKRIVTDPLREKEIGWGQINIPMRQTSFQIIEDLAKNYLNTRKRLYVVDGYAGYDKEERIRIRVVCTRAYHALFMTNMLVRPT